MEYFALCRDNAGLHDASFDERLAWGKRFRRLRLRPREAA
jgi:hypothetical protein